MGARELRILEYCAVQCDGFHAGAHKVAPGKYRDPGAMRMAELQTHARSEAALVAEVGHAPRVDVGSRPAASAGFQPFEQGPYSAILHGA